MFKRTSAMALALAMAAPPAIADQRAAAAGYALANGGKTLAVMADLAKPKSFSKIKLAQPLAAIAYRPVTGDLLGFSNGKIYKIDVTSGKLSDLGAKFVDGAKTASGAKVGFNFNNQIDAVRAVSSSGDNLVYFPADFGGGKDPKVNSVRRFTALAYDKADPNAGAKPMIFANAYTNAIDGKKAASTAQFALDAGTDALVTLANNAGTLKTVGKLTIKGTPADIVNTGGLDIVSPAEGDNQAYAVLQLKGKNSAGLYAVDLKTAEATLIADLGLGGITSFAASMKK